MYRLLFQQKVVEKIINLAKNFKFIWNYLEDLFGFIWNQFKYDNIDDKAALLHHYHTFHGLTLQTKPDISDCFFVTFVDQPPKHLLSV